VIIIGLLPEPSFRLAGNAWPQYNEQYRARLCQTGAVFICVILLTVTYSALNWSALERLHV